MKKIKQLVSTLVQRIVKWWANFGTARKKVLIIGSVAYGIVTGINQITAFYDRFFGGGNRSPKEQLQVVSTNETGFVSAKPFEILEPTSTADKATGDAKSLHFIVKQMAAAHQRRDYDDAVHFAITAEKLLSQCDNHDPSVISDQVAIKSCLMEESFYRGDYDRTIELHKEMQTLGDGRYVATWPRFMALESAAALLKSGGTIFFFSPRDLGELKKWDKTMLEEYLSFLAAWGYLQPVMIDPWQKRQTTFYYEEFFGFSKPLPYQRSFMLSVNLTNGVQLTSNEMSARWAGRKRFVPIDLDKCAADELNLSDDEIFRKPLKMSLSFNEDQPETVRVEWSKMDSLDLAPETPISIKTRNAWDPKMRENLKPHPIARIWGPPYGASPATRIPPEIFVLIAVLICMAFASPMKDKDNA